MNARLYNLKNELEPWMPAMRSAARRLLRFALCLVVVLALGAAIEARAVTPQRPVVVASISILADFVRAVAGDALVVESLVPVGSDPHTYEPVPSDARRLAGAELVFRNGFGLERWLDKLIGVSRSPNTVITLTDGMPSLRVAEGAYAGDADPHAWMDPERARHYLAGVERALVVRYPRHATTFAANANRYRRELDALDAEIRSLIATVPPARRQLVTTHDAFRYFSERYGLRLVASIWGISTETEPSAREVARIVSAIRSAGVSVVFVETTINPKLMRRIAAEAGVRVGDALYGDSVGVAGSGADTYIGMMRANARSIARGLAGPATAP